MLSWSRPKSNIVRKIADLLHVPLADFLDAKIKARDSFR